MPRAQAGDVSAMLGLGYHYLFMSRPEKTLSKLWFTKAFSTGSVEVYESFAELYICGHLFERDILIALAMLEAGANRGNTRAARTLGNLFETGDHGAPQDPVRALKWYKVSDSFDYARALYLGLGTKPDARAAFNWLRATEKELDALRVPSGSVKFQLALLYLSGEGTPRNEAVGLRLLREIRDRQLPVSAVTASKVNAILSRAP